MPESDLMSAALEKVRSSPTGMDRLLSTVAGNITKPDHHPEYILYPTSPEELAGIQELYKYKLELRRMELGVEKEEKEYGRKTSSYGALFAVGLVCVGLYVAFSKPPTVRVATVEQ